MSVCPNYKFFIHYYYCNYNYKYITGKKYDVTKEPQGAVVGQDRREPTSEGDCHVIDMQNDNDSDKGA